MRTPRQAWFLICWFVVSLPIAAGAVIAPPAGPVVAVDSNGEELGPVLDLRADGATARFVVALDGNLATLLVVGDGVEGESRVYFELAGCTGQAYIESTGPIAAGAARAGIGGPNLRVYYIAPSNVPNIVNAASYWNEGTDSCTNQANAPFASPASLAGDLVPAYTPPFAIAAPAPAQSLLAVPALERWGLLVLVTGLASVGLMHLRRQL